MPVAVNENVTRFTIGGRYYLQDNVAWHKEFSHRDQNSTAGGRDAREEFFTTRFDLAF
jgi:hypothetical protein